MFLILSLNLTPVLLFTGNFAVSIIKCLRLHTASDTFAGQLEVLCAIAIPEQNQMIIRNTLRRKCCNSLNTSLVDSTLYRNIFMVVSKRQFSNKDFIAEKRDWPLKNTKVNKAKSVLFVEWVLHLELLAANILLVLGNISSPHLLALFHIKWFLAKWFGDRDLPQVFMPTLSQFHDVWPIMQ